ncbi:hypothetical protein Q8A67_023789 [Cirrhinus molitorella]|uniref:Cadherin cytoplasmic C-terminal domain-containing protein n=1 Tax=Cirrhinus molitorella TaxID=172907 RepID=A0AA88P5G0_9TELE|nr:hypothetical protein Q8A67_023789 [Cirrhinus molitorella]
MDVKQLSARKARIDTDDSSKRYYLNYNIPEETKRQYVIGNIAKDLRMDVKQISSRKARIDTEDISKRYFPELKDKTYENNNSKLTSYLIIALVCVSTFFLTFIILIVAVKLCHRKKPRLLFDGAVAVPSTYFPPNYAEVDGVGTLHSSYNYDTYLTTGSRTSDFKFLSSYNENTLPAGGTLKSVKSDLFETHVVTLVNTEEADEV